MGINRTEQINPVRELRSEDQLCRWILAETRKTAGCAEVDIRFALVRREPKREGDASWDLRAVSNWTRWPESCRAAFIEAVKTAQMRFDFMQGPTGPITFPAEAP
jgi:hypothetical protein